MVSRMKDDGVEDCFASLILGVFVENLNCLHWITGCCVSIIPVMDCKSKLGN